jgi:hypothetical protein
MRPLVWESELRRRAGLPVAAVCEKKDAPYNAAALPPSWLKVKNPHYSQGRDRHELFDRRSRVG